MYPAELALQGMRGTDGKKLIVHENQRHMGIISDISVGGCSVTSTRVYKKGMYMRVEFDITPGSAVTAFGKVQSVLRQTGGGTNIIMHVQFIKITGANRNKIYSYIYNYL
jgi:hypothetical protein